MKKVIKWLRVDGILHISVSANICTFFCACSPVWTACILTMVVGFCKEIYDRISRKGTAEWHDIICDAIGTIIGVLLISFYRLLN